MSNEKEPPHTNLNGSSSSQKGNSYKTNIVKAAIYTRTARGNQNDSYLEQVKRCSEYITQKGWILSNLFFDEGVSEEAIERPELSLMLMKAAQYSFDIVVVSSIDRISRSPRELLEVSKILRDFHVALQPVNEPEMSEFGLDEFKPKFS
jgi:DNA invertase Pin-like site-specific DNA recombinase